MHKAAAFLRLIRIPNCMMMGVAVVVGSVLTGALTEINIFSQQFHSLFLGFTTGFFLTGATMAINDYYDRKIDAINEPERPIPSGKIRPNEAIASAILLTALGFIAALFTNWLCFLTASLAWGVFVIYTTRGKRMGFAGNLMVSFCIAVPFIYGGLVIEKAALTTSIFVAMVFFSNTGREITKGIVDVRGDKENNIQTLAVVYGERKAATVASAFYVAAVSLTPLPWILELVSSWFVPFAVLTDAGLVLSSVALFMDPSRKNARKIKNRNLLWFSIGLIAFVAGTVS